MNNPQHETHLVNAAVQAGLLSHEALGKMRLLARERRSTLLETLIQELRLPMSAFTIALAQARNLPYIDLAEVSVDHELLTRLPAAVLRKHPALPVRDRDGKEWLAVAHPDDPVAPETVRRLTGRALPLALAEGEALGLLAQSRAGGMSGEGVAAAAITDGVDPVALFDRILREAYLRRASDIHLESIAGGLRIRLRVDGRMQSWSGVFPRELGDGLLSRVKVLAGMDIAENRSPQDGGMNYTAPGGNEAMEMRVACLPTKFGERVTLRVLKSDSAQIDLAALGMPETMLTQMRRALSEQSGIVLVTGPTGSGKSTTLYAALRELDSARLNILTVEDPIEQHIAGISQVQVGSKVGFAGALRAFLRHDPDVVLVGEIRDRDTADTALRAATTGHMVLSTLHTNSAPGAITRLVDIGCEPFMIAATVRGLIAQRLVRRLCPDCRKPLDPDALDPEMREYLIVGGVFDNGQGMLSAPGGCAHCLGTGYRGRIGLFESLWIDAGLADAIASGIGEGELCRLAGPRWYRLADDARAKVAAGLTSPDEVRPLLQSTRG